jgi:hypothetical protein
MEHQRLNSGSDAQERFRGWRAVLSGGPSPNRSRLRLEGEYRLEPGSNARKLERRIAEDIDPEWFTVHIGDAEYDDDPAPAANDQWIPLAREFYASRDVEYVMLRDKDGVYRLRVQRN